ncbi:MAG: nucleotidyltransferase domain-containing protein [Chloroflexi bacterium]|nr:nucleotidyltransferase domain-containing protein [Chloroflexota bacterium]
MTGENVTVGETVTINLPLEEIRAYCETQPIERLSLFGSAARNELRPESDVDFLVEYEPEAPVGYFPWRDV